MLAIIGLGNPDKKYNNTRHNIGFMAIDHFAKTCGIQFSKTKYKSMFGEGTIYGEKVFLLKPTTYMNNSGDAIKELTSKLKLDLKNIIVILDDIDLPFCNIRLRAKGSGGTHNGLKDIVVKVNSELFSRIRIGIGNDPDIPLVDYVLGTFNKDELYKLDNTFLKTDDILFQYIKNNGDITKILLKNDTDGLHIKKAVN